jgi:hypothetical protein
LQSGNKESVDGKHRIMKKILVIRLSSLGDVVLTAPVLFALRKQLGVEVHLLTKTRFHTRNCKNFYITLKLGI